MVVVTAAARPGCGWVVAHVRDGEAAPRRVFWIYERDGDGWRLVLVQWATPTA